MTMRDKEEKQKLKKEEEDMHKQLALILVKSKEMDKWVPVQFLIKYGINNVNILDLEDKGLLLVKNSESHGRVLKLTLKGYHTFSQFLGR